MRDALSESLYILLDHLNRQWSQPQMNILKVIRNEYFHLLGDDHIAVDANGVPIARAADRAAVERAAPNAAAYFSGVDFAAPADNTYTIIEPPIVQPGVPVSVPVSIPVQTFTASGTYTPNAKPTTQAHAPDPAPADTIGATDSAIAPTDSYPTYVPADQPPQDNEPVEPGAEEFPEPTVPATDPAKLN